MNLSDVTLPVDYEWAKNFALVFSVELAARVSEVQQEVGDARYRLEPTALVDGRYALNADLLTVCVPGGFLYPAFSRLDASRFNEIEVLPIGEVRALFPPEPPLA